MSEVLVLVDHVDGKVRKPTYELLTIAKRLGEPSAVFIGGSDKADDAVAAVKKYGAEKVGLDAAWSAVEGTEERPPRSQGEIVTDEDGSGATALVEFLASKKFI